MAISQGTGRPSRMVLMRNYLLALGLVGTAVICHVALRRIAPGIGPYMLTFPAIVAASIFCGTLPASAAAIAAGMATGWLMHEPSLFARPVFNAAQLDTIVFVPACAAILWATHRLRHTAGTAALAEARLAEVFRQVPAAAAILEAPDGHLLLNSRQSGEILGHAPLGDIAAYGGEHADGTRFAPDDYPIIRALRTGDVVGGTHMR
jgi:hypothetical protein